MTATGSLRRGLVAACLLLAAFSAALAQPVPGVPVDGLGRPVSAENQAAFERTLASIKGRKLSPVDAEFLLTVLNSPPVPSGPFKDREALARHFARAGVGVSGAASGGMAETDLWRLVRAARAASQAYRIPPAILLCLTFRESGFNRSASAWTTSAKGVSQMTNGAVADAVRAIQSDPALRAETEAYARELGAEMPDRVEGAADVDGLTRRMEALRAADAPREDVEAARRERQAAILSHKDEVGHIYNIETNFGLAAAYLSLLRYRHFAEVADEPGPRRGLRPEGRRPAGPLAGAPAGDARRGRLRARLRPALALQPLKISGRRSSGSPCCSRGMKSDGRWSCSCSPGHCGRCRSSSRP